MKVREGSKWRFNGRVYTIVDVRTTLCTIVNSDGQIIDENYGVNTLLHHFTYIPQIKPLKYIKRHEL